MHQNLQANLRANGKLLGKILNCSYMNVKQDWIRTVSRIAQDVRVCLILLKGIGKIYQKGYESACPWVTERDNHKNKIK
jgi:hypothetical protein